MESEKLEEFEKVTDNDTNMLDDELVESGADEKFISSGVADEVNELVESDADEVNELVEDNCDNSKVAKELRIFWKVLSFINALLICELIYMNIFMWNPKERDFCDDNIFCGNSVSISDEEFDEIICSLENELGIEISEEYEDEYSLFNAVLENECLTESEKQVFYGFIDLIKDNPYIDKEEAYRSLRNVDVSYKWRPFNYDKAIQGVYTHSYENIGIFEKDEDNSILIHEGIHCIFCNEKTVGLPHYFKEGITELLCNEYFAKTPFTELATYPLQIAAIKMLCEVTSPDVVLEAYSCGDMNIIAEEMAKTTGDIEVARNALNMLDKTFLKFCGELSENENLSYEKLFTEFMTVFRGIITANYEVTDSNRVSYFYNELLFSNIMFDDAYDKYIDDLVEFGSYQRAYFSSKLKNELASKEVSEDSGKVYER